MKTIICHSCEKRESPIQENKRLKYEFRAQTLAQASMIKAIHKSQYENHEVVIYD